MRPERARRGTDDGLGTGPESEAGGRGDWYGKIKLHLTRDGSRRHIRRSHEAHPLKGTSWFPHRRGARFVTLGAPPDIRTDCRRRADRVCIACRDPGPRPARESLPKRGARALRRRHGDPCFRCVGGGLRGSPCAGSVQPVVKPVVADAGDVVEPGPEPETVNGQPPPGSRSTNVDSLGHSLLYAGLERHAARPGETPVSTRATTSPRSWATLALILHTVSL